MARKTAFAIITGKVSQPTILTAGWDDVKPLVSGVSGAKFKGFATVDDAKAWMRDQNVDTYILDEEALRVPPPRQVDWESVLANRTTISGSETSVDMKSTSEAEKIPPASISGDDATSHNGGFIGSRRRQDQNRKFPPRVRVIVDANNLADVLSCMKIG